MRSLAFAVVIALAFRSLLFEPFYIPSGSMKSTLLEGDYVFVSKSEYGYSRFSFPFSPSFFEGRVFESQPKRGDVVVFRFPSDPKINYIKRLIGLPGDTIQMLSGVLYLNGQAIPKKRVANFIDIDEQGNRTEIPRYMETLPSGSAYYVLDQYASAPLDNTRKYTVPEGHYFMMGDNRDNSQDSRVLDLVGYVPFDHLMGPAKMLFISSNGSLLKVWKWFSQMRFERFFTIGFTLDEDEINDQ